MNTLGLEIFTTAWVCAVGACVGSFLNVVIYRLPAGLSLMHPPSRCPRCFSPIRTRDNIPVFGWVLLRGRCRDCHAPISGRYPLVEAGVGALFALVYLFAVKTGGGNLPLREAHRLADSMWETEWSVIVLGLLHAFLLCVLFAASLIAWDRKRIPIVLISIAAVCWLIAFLVRPEYLPIPFANPHPDWAAGRMLALMNAVCGDVAGGAVGLCLSLATAAKLREDGNRVLDLVMVCGLIGVFVGWQTVLAIGAVSAVLLIPRGLIAPRFPTIAIVFAVTATMLLRWKTFAESSIWPTFGGWGSLTQLTPLTASTFAWAIVMSCSLARWIGRQPSLPEQ